jgi:type II secretion system protein H
MIPKLKVQDSRFKVQGFRLPSTRRRSGFTLIELILVMAVLTIAISVTAPALAHFFRGRSLDSEARRLLGLTRHGQGRAVSEGIPVELWIDAGHGAFGLEAEPSFEPADPNAVELTLAQDMRLEVVNRTAIPAGVLNIASTRSVPGKHPNLPKIRFLPDGSIAESSPNLLHLIGREGDSIWLAQSRSHSSYEIRTRATP